MKFPRALSLLLPILVLLSACSTPVPTDDGAVFDRGANTGTVADLLRRAERASGVNAAEYAFEAAKQLYKRDATEDAVTLLASIPREGLPPVLNADIQLMQADLEMELERPRAVLELLQSSTVPELRSLPENFQTLYHRLRAQAYYDIDAMLSSALERMQLDRLLDGQDKQNNHDLIWEALGALPVSQLQALASTAINFEVRGWYELALIARRNGNDLDRQLVELRQWREGWTRHPAADSLPTAMDQVAIMAQQRPRRIALLLPLQTNEGTIVRDAFMSAYFNLLNLGGQVPEVRLYDTTNVPEILGLHRQAVDDGAQLIIGPLLKEHVSVLQQVRDLGVPTLALNNIEGSRPVSQELYQFSLSPEDEARQLADKIWRDGHRRIAILHPVDDTRKRDTFVDAWLRLGGDIVAMENFADNNYTAVISRMLELDHSNERHTRIDELLGAKTHFQPRRRQDIDCLLMIAPVTAARQIVPSLAYLYAGDIPVYATQDLYTGIPSPVEDRDLNGVTFGESPWVLGRDDTSVTQARTLFPLSTAQALRLQAFGIDAFRLYPRLNLLDSSPNAVIPGASGMLRMGPDQNIVRQLTWTNIRDGLAVAMEE